MGCGWWGRGQRRSRRAGAAVGAGWCARLSPYPAPLHAHTHTHTQTTPGAHLQPPHILKPRVGHLWGQTPQHRGPRPPHRAVKVRRRDPQARQELRPLHGGQPSRHLCAPYRLHGAHHRRLCAHRRHVGRHVAAQARRQRAQRHPRVQRHLGAAAAQHRQPLRRVQRAQSHLRPRQGGGSGLGR